MENKNSMCLEDGSGTTVNVRTGTESDVDLLTAILLYVFEP